MSGARTSSTTAGGVSRLGQASASILAPVPTNRTAPTADARAASAAPAIRGATSVRPPGAEHLQIDVLMPGIDGDRDRGLVVGRDIGRGVGRERGEAERRLGGGERDAARRRDADAQPGEASWPGGDADAVERRKRHVGLLHDALDQRHQRLSVTADHRQRFARHPAALGVEHGGGAGLERGIDREHTHGNEFSTADDLSTPASHHPSPPGEGNRMWHVLATSTLYLPLKRGGRFAVSALTRVFDALWQTGWGSKQRRTRAIPTPTLPFSRGGSALPMPILHMRLPCPEGGGWLAEPIAERELGRG